jgi:hypothetical protein
MSTKSEIKIQFLLLVSTGIPFVENLGGSPADSIKSQIDFMIC